MSLVFSCSKGETKSTNNEIQETSSQVETSIEQKHQEHASNNQISDTINIQSYLDLDLLFDSLDYHLENVRATDSVPRIFLLDIRKSLSQENSSIRKYDFIRIILSNCLFVNEKIILERKFIQNFMKSEVNSNVDQKRINSLLAEFRATDVNELLDKVDIIPPSLIVCQAILESGWGQSHFAYEGNSLFGEHAPAGSKSSIKAKGANIGLRTFPSIHEAILGYTKNLNRHNAYQGLRDVRKKLRSEDKIIDGIALANALNHYSELGKEYTITLKKMISIYALTEFDDDHLQTGVNLFVEVIE